MTPPRDDFDGPAGPGFMAAVRHLRLPALPGKAVTALGVALLLVVGAVIAVSYPQHHAVPADGQVPVIHAQTTPYRVKPDDPGGMAIPYRESTVFDALHGGEAPPAPPAEGQGKVENLLGLPEQPMARDKMFPDQKAAAPPQSPAASNGAVPQAVASPPAPPPLPSAPAAASPAAETTSPPITRQAPAPEAANPPASPEPAAIEKPETQKTEAGDAYIQLGAEKSADAAQAVWTKAKAANAGTLGDLNLHVQKAALPKGTFYRVQGGPLPAAKAKAICAALNAKKAGSCLVAHR